MTARMDTPPPRILLAKLGLDEHDRGVKVIARALRYAGKWQTPRRVRRSGKWNRLAAPFAAIAPLRYTPCQIAFFLCRRNPHPFPPGPEMARLWIWD